MTKPTRPTSLDLDEIAARAAGLYEYATGLDDAWQAEADQLAGTDVPALLDEVRRLRARTLTESEYTRAWHAIEGTAGEPGADPATVLNAVLRALGIDPPVVDAHIVRPQPATG